jgi:hypothetical protein
MIEIARHPLILGSLSLALFAAACGTSVQTSTGGNGGTPTTICPQEAPPCCDPTQVDQGCCLDCSTTSTGVGGAGGSAGTPCGGFTGATCPPDQYCDFPDNLCGAADGSGVCTPKPTGCSDIYQPTCGCDGQVHPSPCDAASAGSDQNDLGGCMPPPGMFACGSQFCMLGSYYCEMDTSDVGSTPSTFACKPVPDACGGTPSCECLAGVACGWSCAMKSDGGLEVTCGGG